MEEGGTAEGKAQKIKNQEKVVKPKFEEVEGVVAVRTSQTNPNTNPQVLVSNKYLFKRERLRHDDVYKCFTRKNHHCPSQLKKSTHPITGVKTWAMSPHEDNDVCVAHQASGVWRECGKNYTATQHGDDYLIDMYGHVFKYIPYVSKFDNTVTRRLAQTQYKCLLCDDVKIRLSSNGQMLETWSDRNKTTKIFEKAVHLNEHERPVKEREEILAKTPIQATGLDGRSELRSQTDALEVLSEVPVLVSSVGKFLSTFKDELDYLYRQDRDQLYGRLKVFTCIDLRCKGMLRMREPEDGIIKWERIRHDPTNEVTVDGVKQAHECRTANTKISIPLKNGQISFFENVTPRENTEEEMEYIAEEDDKYNKIYSSYRREYGTLYRCLGNTCCASLRVLVNYSHEIWEKAHLRIIAGGAFVPQPHTCADDGHMGSYGLLKSVKVVSKLLDLTKGKILKEAEQSSSQDLLDEVDAGSDEDEDGEVSRARIAEPDKSGTIGVKRRKESPAENEESRIRPDEEFEPLFESPEFEYSQNSEETKKKDVSRRGLSLRQVIQEVDNYCEYNQKAQPGERAKYWQRFIDECKELNSKNKAWCVTRRLGEDEVKTCPIREFENTVSWSERVETLGWLQGNGRLRTYKCKIMECNKSVVSKLLGTCSEHASSRCFSFISILCAGAGTDDVKKIFMTYIVRAFDESVPLEWSDEQAVKAFKRKKEIGLDVERIESVLKFNVELGGMETDRIEKEKYLLMAQELYSVAQLAVFLTTSFRSKSLSLERVQLNVDQIGSNFKEVLHMNGFDYDLLCEDEYIKYAYEKYGTDGENGRKKFRRMVKLSRRDIHDESRRGLVINALTRLCFKKDCKVGAHWWHIYFAKFAKALAEDGHLVSRKGVTRQDIYVGLAPPDCPSILAGVHNVSTRDPTRLGAYMLARGYKSIMELREDDIGYMFAKESEAECKVGEGLAMFGIVLLAADQIDDIGMINKYMPIFRKFTTNDLLDLRTLMLAKFELIFYPRVAKMKEGEEYLLLEPEEEVDADVEEEDGNEGGGDED